MTTVDISGAETPANEQDAAIEALKAEIADLTAQAEASKVPVIDPEKEALIAELTARRDALKTQDGGDGTEDYKEVGA